MADPVGTVVVPAAVVPAVTPAASKPAATPAPVPVAQPTPAAAAKPGAPVTPAPGQVPLASLMEEREKRQALQSELEQLRTTVNQIQQRQQPAPAQQPVPQQDMKAELDKLWQSDPRKAVQTEIALAAQWMDNVNAQVDGEAATLAGKYTDFNSYRDTAMRYVRALPLDQRAKPGIVEMAYLVTRGQNVDQIIKTQQEQMVQRFLTNPAEFQMPAGSSSVPLTPSGGPQATEAQIRAAGAMRVPIDQYMKWVK